VSHRCAFEIPRGTACLHIIHKINKSVHILHTSLSGVVHTPYTHTLWRIHASIILRKYEPQCYTQIQLESAILLKLYTSHWMQFDTFYIYVRSGSKIEDSPDLKNTCTLREHLPWCTNIIIENSWCLDFFFFSPCKPTAHL